MVKYRVYISDSAEEDLCGIVKYISSQLVAPITAAKMMDTIGMALIKLSEIPHAYPNVKDERLTLMGYRRVVIKNYIAFFTINEKEKVIDVERILYARRDWANLL